MRLDVGYLAEARVASVNESLTVTLNKTPATLQAMLTGQTPQSTTSAQMKVSLKFANIENRHLEIADLDAQVRTLDIDWNRQDLTYYLVTDVIVANFITIEADDQSWVPSNFERASFRKLDATHIEVRFNEPVVVAYKSSELLPRSGPIIGSKPKVVKVPDPNAPSGTPTAGRLDISRLEWTSRVSVPQKVVPNASSQNTLGGMFDCLRELLRRANIPTSRTWVYAIGNDGFAIVVLPQRVDDNTGKPFSETSELPPTYLSLFRTGEYFRILKRAVGADDTLRRSIVFAVASEANLRSTAGPNPELFKNTLRQDPGHAELPEGLRKLGLGNTLRIEAFILEFERRNSQPERFVPSSAARLTAEMHLIGSGLFKAGELR
jgi:hypothetical protein